jgi:hypothetical protein
MPTHEKHTLQEVIEAIRGTSGIKRLIASKLNVHRHTVDRYLLKWATAREAYNEEVENVGDVAESVIITRLSTGDADMAKWYAAVKLKNRGYQIGPLRVTPTDMDGGKPYEGSKVVVYIPENNRDPDNAAAIQTSNDVPVDAG